MLALALMPTLSRALAFVQGGSGGYAAVCTPQGMQWVASDGQHVLTEPTALSSPLDHCLFCPLAAVGAAPLPTGAMALALPLAGDEAPRAFLHAARTPHAWRRARPRGPPPSA